MKAFILACVAIVVLAVVPNYALNSMGFSTQDQTAGTSVRVE